MLIQGPLTIRAEEAEGEAGFLLRIGFREEFQDRDPPARTQEFLDYLQALQREAQACAETDPNRQGMLLVLQVAEQLLPLIREDSLPLGEEIEIRVEQKASLLGLLNPGTGAIN